MSEFQHLSKAQIFAGLPGVSFSKSAHRSKQDLLREVSLLSEAQRDQLHCHAQTISKHPSRKRRADSGEQVRNVRQRQGSEANTPTVEQDPEAIYNTKPFLDPLNPETYTKCYSAFVTGTSNAALSSKVCAVCATEHPAADGDKVQLSALENSNLLKPAKDHAAHQLFGEDGILLSLEHTWQEEGKETCWVCRPCRTALQRGQMPELALANDLWIGPVPPCLEILTLPEQMLIARHYARVYVFKMYPKRGGGTWLPSDQRQRGMRGNVVSFRWNTNRVVDMLEGKIAPRQLDTLASVIAVSFIGPGKLPERWLRATFRVRRQRVLEALIWLKANNPLYHDVEIDMERIRQLPEDDVPEAITTNICQTADAAQATRESETYVPNVEEDVPATEETDQAPPEVEDTENVVPLEHIGVEDTDLTGLSQSDILMHALAVGQAPHTESGYATRHSRLAVPDLGPLRDRQPEDDTDVGNPLATAYPTLFPYGVRLMEASRI